MSELAGDEASPLTSVPGDSTPLWRRVLPLAAIVALALAVRIPFLSVPMITDEGGYGYWATIWTHDHVPFRDFTFARPLGILVVYKIILATVGGDIEEIRLFAALYNCLTVAGIFFFARAFFSERAAWASAALYAVFSASPRIEGFTANAEIFTLAPLVLNAYLTWRRRWFWAGVASAVAFWLKPSGVEGCMLVAIWVFASWESWRKALVAASSGALGFAVGLLPEVLHGVWIAGWNAYWFSMYTVRKMAFSGDVTSASSQLARAENGVMDTMSSWIVPALLFVVALMHMTGSQRRFCLAWLAAAIFGMQIGFWWDWHFFMQIVPPLSFAAGAGLLALPSTRLRFAWAIALVVACLSFYQRDGSIWFDDPKQISWEVYQRNGYLVAKEVSDYVARTTAPDDLLYIAFGQAEIYYESNRRPALPTQMFYPVAAYNDAEWPKIVDTIESRRAAVVVWVQPPPPNRMSTVDFTNLLTRGYDFEKDFMGVSLYRRKAEPAP